MTSQNSSLSSLSDSELISAFSDLVAEEREALVAQLEHLIELDRRKLFFHYPSLRAYLVAEHGMEEWKAEKRIQAARILRKYPALKPDLDAGRLNLTLLKLASGCAARERLSESETSELFQAISGMSCKAAMREIASRFPKSADLPEDRIRPLTEDLSEVRFVAPNELLEKLEDIRGLLAHSHPQASMAEVIDVLEANYRERFHPEEKAKRALRRQEIRRQTESLKTPAAQPVNREEQSDNDSPQNEIQPRTPPDSMLRDLIRRDGFQCSYVDPITKMRCISRHALEVDHIHPWSHGGKTELSNLRFLCGNHHRRVSFLKFGDNSRYAKDKAG